MAVAANALTTLATVLDELGLEQDSGVKDTRLERYINAASDFVASFCGRTFQRADNIAEKVRGRGGTLIQVSRRPIITIDSITVDLATVAATDYHVDNAGRGLIFRSTGWPWEPARMPGLSYAPIPGTEEPTIIVTYDGGFVTPAQADQGLFSAAPRTLPYDLEDVVIQLAVSRWKLRGRDVRVVAESYDSGGGFTFGGAPVAPEILAVLDNYTDIPNA